MDGKDRLVSARVCFRSGTCVHASVRAFVFVSQPIEYLRERKRETETENV